MLGERGYRAASRTTVNAHYTDPAYARATWQALERLGFEEGRVLEPGAGAGVFIGTAPPGAQMTGVELDPASAAIAQVLAPQATIRAESFAKSPFADGHFDAVVGNVPFGGFWLADPRHNAAQHSIHNHFIIKSLALTRPGGLVAVLTSQFTLDAEGDAARREMHTLGDLVGAVRLPTGAHRHVAGTEAITDLVVFRRREPGVEPGRADWLESRPRLIDGTEVRVNAYFDAHPEHVLGTLAVGSGMYSAQTLQVRGDPATTAQRLDAALAAITRDAELEGLTMAPRAAGPEAESAQRQALEPAPAGFQDGHILDRAAGRFAQVLGGNLVALDVPASQARQLSSLLGMRDTARQLLQVEATNSEVTAEMTDLRRRLRTRYEAYVARYGPINGYKLARTGRTDEVTGEPRYRRAVPPAVKTLRQDPSEALVRALENFDDSTGAATPAAILTKRVIAPREPVRHVDDPGDALAITIERHGRVELDTVASLLGCHPWEARARLGELVYDDPADERLVPAPEYLSGNVREKLERAKAVVDERPELVANVRALEAVLPRDLGMDEVEARLGAAWIDAETHQQFLSEILGDTSVRVVNPVPGAWEVVGKTHTVAAINEWGTQRMPAPAIVKAILEQRAIVVRDKTKDGKPLDNPVETANAQDKATALQERFSEWVWEEPERARRLLAEYNRRFNAIVLRDYTAEGARLTLPGLATTFKPREHQRTAVARMLAEPAVGLFHEVGAGKTAEMVMGAMELKRLGLVSKPVVVVPNHMLEQFSREWLQLYPQAKVLSASSEDLKAHRRRLFVSRVATNDWDGVVMTRTAFTKLKMSPEAQTAYIEAEVESLREALEQAKDSGEKMSVKRTERMLLAAEGRLEKKVAKVKDPGISFEDTGIDYLIVDEAHDYKNLRTASNMQDAAIDGADRSSDLHMKIEYLRSRHGERVVTMATATPIANSVTETHVMMRYLRPDLLVAAGVDVFDVWGATFGRQVTEMEMDPAGRGYKSKTRFASFQNVPEMMRMWYVFGDVKTAADLNLDVPALAADASGKRRIQMIAVPPSPELKQLMAELGRRADTPSRDRAKMLRITNDGRKGALDLRLLTGVAPSADSKVDVAARRIAAIWRENKDRIYIDPATERPSPTPGALQLVFCDLGVPGDRWNVYEELRDQLVEQGIPRAQVRFIHEAKSDEDRARLFKAARSGEVAVLVGSSQKMGVGTNIQTRAIALHHLDCPWRPADLAQREGRIIRQGNQNEEVSIYRYVAEGSFDTFLWQTIERKARFIHKLMNGSLDVREIEDIGDATLSAAEAKAIASGNPLLLDKATTDTELVRLERLHRAYARNQQALDRTIDLLGRRVVEIDAELPVLQAVEAQRQETRGKAFRMTIGGRQTDERMQAASLLREWALRFQAEHGRAPRTAELGELGGLPIVATYERTLRSDRITLTLRDANFTLTTLDGDELAGLGLGSIRQLENRLVDLPALIEQREAERNKGLKEIDKAKAALQRPFRHLELLETTRIRAREIDAELKRQAEESAKSKGTEPATKPSDPLAPHREVLGEVRFNQLNQRANELVGDESGFPASWLQEHPRDGSPFASLDRAGARETLRLERDHRIAREQLESGDDQERDLAHRNLARLDGRLREMREEGTHLDCWFEREAELAARWVAIERTLGPETSQEAPVPAKDELVASPQREAVAAPAGFEM